MISQKGFAFWAFTVAVVTLVIGMVAGSFEVVKFANILLGYAIAALFTVAWLEFYMTRKEKTNESIAAHPLALAVLTGAVVIAGAISGTLF